MEGMGPEDYLRRIPFAVASIAEVCTGRGSYEREIANRVYSSIKDDIEKVLKMLEDTKVK